MSEFEKLEERMDKRFDDLTALMSEFANDMNARFDQQDARFDRIEEELREQNEKYDHLVTTIDGFIKRIDDYEIENAARDHKIDRLERWIKAVADQAGVKLPV